MHGNGREQSTPVPPKKTGNKRQRQQPEPEQLTPEQLSERIGLDAVTALDTIRTGSITAYRDVAKAIIHGRERAEAQVGKTSGNEYDEAVKAYYRRFGLDDDHLKPEWKSHCLALCGDDEIWAST